MRGAGGYELGRRAAVAHRKAARCVGARSVGIADAGSRADVSRHRRATRHQRLDGAAAHAEGKAGAAFLPDTGGAVFRRDARPREAGADAVADMRVYLAGKMAKAAQKREPERYLGD